MELSDHERIIFDALCDAARTGAICPKNEDLSELIGASSTSTVPQIIERLVTKGLIERETYQRSRRVKIIASGQITAAPKNIAPHWRNRRGFCPTPSPQTIRHREPAMGEEIMAWARRRNVPYAEALADLVFVGWEVERGRA